VQTRARPGDMGRSRIEAEKYRTDGTGMKTEAHDGPRQLEKTRSRRIDHGEGPALGRWKKISKIYAHRMNPGQRRPGRTNRAQTMRAPEKNELGKEI
jgi:hypothetical protein